MQSAVGGTRLDDAELGVEWLQVEVARIGAVHCQRHGAAVRCGKSVEDPARLSIAEECAQAVFVVTVKSRAWAARAASG